MLAQWLLLLTQLNICSLLLPVRVCVSMLWVSGFYTYLFVLPCKIYRFLCSPFNHLLFFLAADCENWYTSFTIVTMYYLFNTILSLVRKYQNSISLKLPFNRKTCNHFLKFRCTLKLSWNFLKNTNAQVLFSFSKAPDVILMSSHV